MSQIRVIQPGDGYHIFCAINELRRCGIVIEEAEANLITDRVSLRLSWRDAQTATGYLAAMIGRMAGTSVLKTHVLTLEPGMHREHWTVGEQLSDVRSRDLRSLMIETLTRVADNAGPKGLDSQGRYALGVLAGVALGSAGLLEEAP
jgi:hypothetical protein